MYKQKQDLHYLEDPSLHDSLQEDDICQHDLDLLPHVMVTSPSVIINVRQLKYKVLTYAATHPTGALQFMVRKLHELQRTLLYISTKERLTRS